MSNRYIHPAGVALAWAGTVLLLAFVPAVRSEAAADEEVLGDILLEHEKPFSWRQEIYVKPTAPAGKTVELPIKIRAQVCAKSCFQEDYYLSVPITISAAAPLKPAEKLLKRLAIKQPPPKVVPIPKGDLPKASVKAPPTRKGPEPEHHATFKVMVSPVDPFSDQNVVELPKGKNLEVQRGATFILTITGKPDEGYHTYPLTRRAPDQPTTQLCKLTYERSKKARRGGAVGAADKTPPVADVFQPIYPIQESEAEWRDYRKAASASSGSRSSPNPSNPSTANSGLIASILQAIGGGFVALLTPCVFPMIPITVSYFLKQAEKRTSPALALAGGSDTGITSTVSAPAEPKSYPPLLMAAVYSGTIVLVLSVGGLLLMRVLQRIIALPVTNFVLAGVFLFFALSLLGMYEITLPSWLQDKTSSGENRGGLAGVFFMALTFSIVSFACVGPIYGGFLALGAADQSLADRYWKAVPPVLGFSVAFASPFFLLALFPTLLKSLPRAGSWMNSVKVVIGFLELAAGVGFVRAGELLLTKSSTFFTFDLCLGIYIAIALACGLYLLGIYRLPHDHESPESIGVPRLVFALSFIAFGLYLLPGLFKGPDGDAQRPRGKVFAWVESFLLPEIDTPTAKGVARGAQGLVWHHNLREALAEAKREGKLVFVDVTGINCKNCRLNEQDVFPDPRVQAAFAQHVLLKLYADGGVPKGIDQQPGDEETIDMRWEMFRTRALPVYALLAPKDDSKYGFAVFRLVTPSSSGLISDIPEFVQALSKE